MTSMRLSAAEHRRLRRRARIRRELVGWAFLSPFVLFFVVFLVVPVFGTGWWSTQFGGLTTGTHYVGLDNFTRLPDIVGAGAAIQNTLLFALMSVPLILIISLAIGLLLARITHGGAVYRFLIYFPVLVPPVVAALIWLFLTNSDFGLFNEILRALGAQPITWLGASTALPVLAALDIWRNVGYWAIFFVAAIIGLPEELYQAASLDGAEGISRLRYITLPLLRRILLFAIVVATIWGLQVFDTALVLTNGGPGTSTTTIVLRVWQYVFGSNNKVGYAAAISLVFIAAILILTLIQLYALRSRRGED
jgi:multiple sugar transport system permease protein